MEELLYTERLRLKYREEMKDEVFKEVRKEVQEEVRKEVQEVAQENLLEAWALAIDAASLICTPEELADYESRTPSQEALHELRDVFRAKRAARQKS